MSIIKIDPRISWYSEHEPFFTLPTDLLLNEQNPTGADKFYRLLSSLVLSFTFVDYIERYVDNVSNISENTLLIQFWKIDSLFRYFYSNGDDDCLHQHYLSESSSPSPTDSNYLQNQGSNLVQHRNRNERTTTTKITIYQKDTCHR